MDGSPQISIRIPLTRHGILWVDVPCEISRTNEANMNKEVLMPRIKSFSWRLGGMVVVAVLSFLIDNAVDLQIPAYGVVLAGLVVGEVTKYLNR